MLAICEKHGKEHNLVFSTDPVPKLSKTECVNFCGRMNNVKYPASWVVILNYRRLGAFLKGLLTVKLMMLKRSSITPQKGSGLKFFT